MAENKALSEREQEILHLLATGVSNKEISQKLFISENTTKVHLRNIFAKIGVSSRTEATLYAIRQGLVQIDRSAQGVAAEPVPIVLPHLRPRRIWVYAIIAPVAVLLVIAASVTISLRQLPPIASASPAPIASNRWKARASLPSPLSNFGATAFENKIYVMGGESDGKIVAAAERYDPEADSWDSLAPMPTAVADMSAVVVGGRIYVPGGRIASGRVTNILEAYDPNTNQWETRAAMPLALSAYSLAAFEGKIYLFGGWDGEHYVASAYEYDPSADEWQRRAPMPTARGYAGAAIVGGKIHVIGGCDDKQALAVNEQYSPDRDSGDQTPWASRQPLPSPRCAMGVASVADFVYVIGGRGASNTVAPPLQYLSLDKWQEIDSPASRIGSNLALVPVQTFIYAFGGQIDKSVTSQNLAYQAIYTIIIPVRP
jgi:DNA-binding CsgD family transcriptional regulator